MKNPEALDYGYYIYKRKNTDKPSILEIDINSGIPIDTKGWWLGPLETKKLDTQTLPCLCKNCKCWIRRGKSAYGICRKHPPNDNNWSAPIETEVCWEFVPNFSNTDSNHH